MGLTASHCEKKSTAMKRKGVRGDADARHHMSLCIVLLCFALLVLLYCIVVVSCIVPYCIALYCIVLHCIGTERDMVRERKLEL